MDSTVDAALAAKLSMLFPPSDDVFLAFPRSGAAFTLDELDIFDTGEGSSEEIRVKAHHKAQFSRIVNQVPQDSAIYQNNDRLLWEEYNRVLERAEVAKSVLTQDEAQRLGEARDLLEAEVEIDGIGTTTVYSPKLTAYYQYKEAWEDAERVYLDEKITAQASANPEVRAGWEERREAELDAIRDRAVKDWALLGFKDAVEEAQATIASLGGRSPEVLRQELLSNYEACVEPDLVAFDPNGVLSTFYSPSDIFDPDVPWETLHLTSDEVKSLHAQAPKALRSDNESDLADVESVTIEYADVTLIRPWLNQSWLAMTSWRLPRDDVAVISDGEVPRAGTIPVHISSMVVARRIAVKRREGAVGAPSKGTDMASMLSMAVLSRAVIVTPGLLGGKPRKNVTVPARKPDGRPKVRRRDHRAVAVQAHPMMSAKLAGMTIARSDSAPTVRADLRAVVQPAYVVPARRGEAAAKAPSEPAAAEDSTDVDLESVVVLAYRCRRTPLSPNPDSTLDWGEGRSEPKAGAPAGQAADADAEAAPFPLPARHCFAAKKGGRRHTGHKSAQDRSNIRLIQSRLVGHGHIVDVDGYLGPQSERALRAFQEAGSLEVDGLVGPATWAALWA